MNIRKHSFALSLILCVLIGLFSIAVMAESTEQIPQGNAENISVIADAGFYTNSADAAVAADPTDETGANHVFKFTSTKYAWFETKASLLPLSFDSNKAYRFDCTFWFDPDAAVTESYVTLYLYSAKTDYHADHYYNMRNFKYKASDGKYHFSETVNAGILNPNDTTYEFGFRVDSADAVVYADDFSVTAIEPEKPKHIALAETVFAPGTSLPVTVTDPADGSWVGVFASGVIPNSNNYNDYSWKYCKYAASDGTLLMKVPAEPGKYTLYYFSDGGGYVPLESLSFEVAKQQKVFINKSVYRPDETITVTYKGAASTQAWVCIYKGKGSSRPGDGTPDMKTWKYVPNAGDGTMTFTAPSDPGGYTVYLLKDGGYTVVESVTFTVAESSGLPIVPASVAFERAENAPVGYADGVMTATAAETVTDGVLFYWGDQNGILESYTYIGYGTYDQNTGKYTYVPTSGNLIPSETSRLYAYGVTGSAYDVQNGTAVLSEDAVYCEIEYTAASLGKLLYSFDVISDLHVSENYDSNNGKNVLAAFTDIQNRRASSIGVFTAGDNVNLGKPEEYAVLAKYISDTGLSDMPFYYTVGNHEFYYEQTEGAASGEFFDNNWKRFREFAGWEENEFYRYAVIDGDYFIFMGEEARGTFDAADNKQGTADGYFSEAQREWLRGLLNKASSENANAFVFMHQSIDNTVAGSFAGQNWSGINDDDKMQAIIEGYPNTVLFTGHSHWNLHSKAPFINGGTTGASYVNTASCGYLWSDANKGVPGSEGLTVEVYENDIVIRGRDFTNRKWVPAVYACVPKNADFNATETPVTSDETSIRTSGVSGIRFNTVFNKAAAFPCDEIGFMVTRDKYFTDSTICGGEDSRFILANDKLNTPQTVSTGIAYSAEQNINHLREDISGETVSFAATLCGIPQKAAFYKELLHVRAYVKKDGITYYGNATAKSLYEAALAYKAAHPDDENAFIQSIIDTVENT